MSALLGLLVGLPIAATAALAIVVGTDALRQK